MKILTLPLGEIKPYEKNPRINDAAVQAVAESFSQCGYNSPIIVDEAHVILAGHTRLKAMYSLGWTEAKVVQIDGLTEEQKRKYRLLDNKTAEIADWDMELLADELEGLDFGDLVLDWGFDEEKPPRYNEANQNDMSLAERYGMPPFSVLDCRSGAWQERKKAWINLGINSGEGRAHGLLGGGGLDDLAKNSQKNTNLTGTSVFDPVLTELMYYWFNKPGGSIYDCFAGGSVRGVVAAYLGYNYTGIDLSQEQIAEDVRQAEAIGVSPRYICDDSLNADKYVADESADMIFSCPPYADLEVYSDNPRDISTMKYPDFLRVYREIISIACRKLKKDRFAVFVVGDVRDKRGVYRNFVKDTQDAFTDCGLAYYNEIILVTQIATGALRAARQFNSGRKVVKTHQNVLVFYKGDLKKIRDNFPPVDVDETLVKEIGDGEL